MKKYDAWRETTIRNLRHQHNKTDVTHQRLLEYRVVAAGYWEPREHINANKNLTEDGKRAERRKLADAIVTEIEKRNAEDLKKLDAHITAERAALYPSVRVEPSKAEAMAAQLRGFTPEDRTVLYGSASDETRRLMEAASGLVGDLPFKGTDGRLGWAPLIDGKAMQDAVEARALKTNPESVAKLKELTEIREITERAAKVAINEIREA